MLKFLQNRKIRALEKRLADLRSVVEAKQRVIDVLTEEVQTLGSVLARDRARVAAETAELARRRAEAEGDGQTN